MKLVGRTKMIGFRMFLMLLVAFVLMISEAYPANLEKVVFEKNDQRIYFHFDREEFDVKPVSTASLELLNFSDADVTTDWTYKSFTSDPFLSYIRIYKGKGYVKIIIGKKNDVVCSSRKIGRILSFEYHKKGDTPKISSEITEEKTQPVKEVKAIARLSRISLEEKAGHYVLNFDGTGLIEPKILKDDKKLILIFLNTEIDNVDETILLYRGPLILIKVKEADSSARVVISLDKDTAYELEKLNDQKIIMKFPRPDQVEVVKIAKPVLIETISTMSDEKMGDAFVLKGKNLKELELSRAMNQIVLKGRNVVHYIKDKSRMLETCTYIEYYRLVQSGNEVRLVIGLKDFSPKDEIKFEADDTTLKIVLKAIQPQKNEELPALVDPISPTVRNIQVQRKDGEKQIVIELDQVRKFEVFRPNKDLILSITGGTLDKDIDLVKVTDELFTGYRLLKSAEGVKLILIFEEPVETLYFSSDNLITVKYSKKIDESEEKKDALKNLIDKLTVQKKVVEKGLEKKEPVQPSDITAPERQANTTYLEKVKYFKNEDSRELLFILSRPPRYRVIRGKNQIIINMQAESVLKDNTHFIYDEPVNFVRISRQDDILRLVVVLSHQVDPQIISVDEGILLKFPVLKKEDPAVVAEKEKKARAEVISLPENYSPEIDVSGKAHQRISEYSEIDEDNFSLEKVNQSLKIIVRKKKADELYRSAVAEIKREEYGKAFDDLNSALQYLPEDEKILQLINQIRPLYRVHQYTEKGLEYSKKGDWTSASLAFREALNIDPDHIKAKYLLSEAVKMKELNDQYYRANVFFQNGRYNDAKKILKMILEVKGDLKNAIVLFGKCFESENRFEEALAQYQIGLKYYPVDSDLRNLSNAVTTKKKIKELYAEGREYEKNQDWDKALLKYEEGVNLKRDLEANSREQSDELIKKGYMAYLKRELDVAIVSFKKVIELDWENIKAHYWLGKIYIDKGEISLATAEFKIVSRLDPDNNISLLDFVKDAQEDSLENTKIVTEEKEFEYSLSAGSKKEFSICDGSSQFILLKSSGADFAEIELSGKSSRLEMNLAQLFDLNTNGKNDTSVILNAIEGDFVKIKIMLLSEDESKIAELGDETMTAEATSVIDGKTGIKNEDPNGKPSTENKTEAIKTVTPETGKKSVENQKGDGEAKKPAGLPELKIGE